MNNGAYTWYFPVTKDNFYIIGEGNVVVYGNEFAVNGTWSHQNLVTVSGDNVTIKGITFMPKNEANKTIEVRGANFTMKNCKVTSNTVKNYGLFAGNLWVEGNNSTFDGNTFDYSGITIRALQTSLIKNNTFNYGSRADSWDNECVSARGTATLENNTFNHIQPVWTNSTDPSFGNNNYPILPKGDGVINIKTGNNFPDGAIYWTAQDDGIIQLDGTPIPYVATTGLATAITGGGTIYLRAVTYDVGNDLAISGNITIIGNGAKIDGVSPVERSGLATNYGKNPVIYITAGNVTLENLIISGETTPAPNYAVDGITATGGNLTLNNVTIDGIFHADGPHGVQSGNGVTLYNAVQLTATNSTFKRFNKHGVILHNTSSAVIDHCSFIGNNLPLQNAAQNGIVFRKDGANNATGSVSNSSFKDFVYDGDSSIGVWVYTPNAVEPSVVDGGGNTYTNNDRDWYVGDN
jgi:hypothetical protein